MKKLTLLRDLTKTRRKRSMTVRLRYEIMAIMMILFSVTLIGILVAINVINYSKATQEETDTLQFYLENKQRTNMPDKKPEKEDAPPQDNNDAPVRDKNNRKNPRFSSYPLFFAKYTKDAVFLSMDANYADSFSEESMKQYFELALKEKDEHGMIEGFRYLYRPTPHGYDIALMDCSVSLTNRRVLLFSTLLLGIFSICAFALFSFFLSGLVVRPVKDAFERQNDFICAASHELKTPLTVIMANSELLLDQYGNNKWLTYIQSECEQMSTLITSLLTLTRLEQDNGWEEQAQLCNLSDAMLERILPFESVAYEKELHFYYTIAPDISVIGIRQQLQQVLSILLDNALYYTSPKGNIRVTLAKNNHDAILTVSNTGEEISLEGQKKLFDRFYREDKARSREDGHFGLGLSIAKSIVTTHRGTISVSCQNGITGFTVTIPAKITPKEDN